MSAGRDRGSATIWVVSCCALLMVIAGVVTVRVLAVLARHRSEVSADLAALAAASRIGVSADGCRAAARVAERNGARLRSCTLRLAPDGRSGTASVQVRVRVALPLIGLRDVLASARAARLPPAGLGPPTPYGMLAPGREMRPPTQVSRNEHGEVRRGYLGLADDSRQRPDRGRQR